MERIVYSDGFLPEPGEGTMCTIEEGKTRQSDAQAADINLTIKKYNLQPLEMVPGWSGKVGSFGDLSVVPSLQEALGIIAVAREHFEHVPADIRAYFDNDPAVMLDAWNMGRDAEVFKKIGWLEELPATPPAVEAATPPA